MLIFNALYCYTVQRALNVLVQGNEQQPALSNSCFAFHFSYKDLFSFDFSLLVFFLFVSVYLRNLRFLVCNIECLTNKINTYPKWFTSKVTNSIKIKHKFHRKLYITLQY